MTIPSRATPSPRALGEDQARRLLRAGLERALEHESASQVSIDRLTQEAGVARSTFYVYFEDKGHFISALAEDANRELLDAAGFWFGLRPPFTKSDVHEAMERLVDSFRSNYSVFTATLELVPSDARVRDRSRAFVRETVAATATHIRRGLAEGFVRPGVDPERTATWLTLMAERGFFTLVLPADADGTDEYVSALTNIVWKTLYRGAQ